MFDSLFKKILHSTFPYVIISYSQSGEDILLNDHIFQNKKNGFYVDIGAHHPKRFSNTYLLYKRGWSGINIDPIPGMKKLFKGRKRDIRINAGISDKSGSMEYHMFHKGAVNTFEERVAKEQEKRYGKPEVVKVEVHTLKEILDIYVAGKEIDFMNVDVEGHELQILKSNDWKRYLPEIIAIEDQGLDLENLNKSNVHLFLQEKRYNLLNKLNYTSIY